MTYLEFARLVARTVKRRVPNVTFPRLSEDPNSHAMELAGATAIISLNGAFWSVRFQRVGKSISMSNLTGDRFTQDVAQNVGQSVAVFLEP